MYLRLSILLVVLASGPVSSITRDDCPSNLPRGKSLIAHEDKCYLFVLEHGRQLEFHNAERECENVGGHLVIIPDRNTQEFLYNTLRDDFNYTGLVWIGLLDKEYEDHFYWIDGSPVTFTNWGEDFNGRFRDCVAMDTKHEGKWNGGRCGLPLLNDEYPFICEFRPVSSVSNANCPSNLLRNEFLIQHKDKCYLFVMARASEREFLPAERECQRKGGQLVVIPDRDTQEFLYNTLINDFKFHGLVWIGLTDKESEGHFVWVDGSEVNFSYWGEDHDGIMRRLKDCVAMNTEDGGKWDEERCTGMYFVDNEHKFVCEFPIVKPTTPVWTPPPTTTTSTPLPIEKPTTATP